MGILTVFKKFGIILSIFGMVSGQTQIPLGFRQFVLNRMLQMRQAAELQHLRNQDRLGSGGGAARAATPTGMLANQIARTPGGPPLNVQMPVNMGRIGHGGRQGFVGNPANNVLNLGIHGGIIRQNGDARLPSTNSSLPSASISTTQGNTSVSGNMLPATFGSSGQGTQFVFPQFPASFWRGGTTAQAQSVDTGSMGFPNANIQFSGTPGSMNVRPSQGFPSQTLLSTGFGSLFGSGFTNPGQTTVSNTTSTSPIGNRFNIPVNSSFSPGMFTSGLTTFAAGANPFISRTNLQTAGIIQPTSGSNTFSPGSNQFIPGTNVQPTGTNPIAMGTNTIARGANQIHSSTNSFGAGNIFLPTATNVLNTDTNSRTFGASSSSSGTSLVTPGRHIFTPPSGTSVSVVNRPTKRITPVRLSGDDNDDGFTSVFGRGINKFTGSTFDMTSTSVPRLGCSGVFQRMDGHTLCMTDSPHVTRAGTTVADKMLILQLHNFMRARVDPPAADLTSLRWDDRLATVAEKWAKQCTLGSDVQRTIPEMGMSVGQNVAVGYDSWQQAVQRWYNEVVKFRYGLDPDTYLGPDGWREVAHYTQIIQNGTYLIGCGFAECQNTEYVRYFACNYAAGQSVIGHPYTAGQRCGQCPTNCRDGLCDCGDVVCYNKGKLDPNTCTCECNKLYKGRSCEILDCPVADNWICTRDWPPHFCNIYANVPEECPYMCGVCGDGNLTVPQTSPNAAFTSAFGCMYSGKRGSLTECRGYGDQGVDMVMCQSEGGTIGCGECEQYFNIKRDYCPVMCGLCDPPCQGRRCSNGGTLNRATCRCECRPPFTGDICEMAQCPVRGDPGFCRMWPPQYCRLYYNVTEECPYMCGICKPTSPVNGTVT